MTQKKNSFIRCRTMFFWLLGWLCVVLGVVGIFLPLLPTTPFLLAALFLFSKSSKRLHNWLLSWPFLRQFWENYRNGCGVTRRTKITALLFLWGMLGISAMLKQQIWYFVVLGSVGIMVSLHLLLLKSAYLHKKDQKNAFQK